MSRALSTDVVIEGCCALIRAQLHMYRVCVHGRTEARAKVGALEKQCGGRSARIASVLMFTDLEVGEAARMGAGERLFTRSAERK
jgi:hypothetical protein